MSLSLLGSCLPIRKQHTISILHTASAGIFKLSIKNCLTVSSTEPLDFKAWHFRFSFWMRASIEVRFCSTVWILNLYSDISVLTLVCFSSSEANHCSWISRVSLVSFNMSSYFTINSSILFSILVFWTLNLSESQSFKSSKSFFTMIEMTVGMHPIWSRDINNAVWPCFWWLFRVRFKVVISKICSWIWRYLYHLFNADLFTDFCNKFGLLTSCLYIVLSLYLQDKSHKASDPYSVIIAIRIKSVKYVNSYQIGVQSHVPQRRKCYLLLVNYNLTPKWSKMVLSFLEGL